MHAVRNAIIFESGHLVKMKDLIERYWDEIGGVIGGLEIVEVELWKTRILPLKKDYPSIRIGSPAVSNGPDGLDWLHRFFGCLGGVQKAGVDFISIHYYSPDAQNFKRYVAASHQAFDLPIWETAFACTHWDLSILCNESAVFLFMKETMGFLDGTEYVERYAWFGAMTDVGEAVSRFICLQLDGKLSPTGFCTVQKPCEFIGHCLHV